MAELLAADTHETGGEVRLPTLGKRGRPFGSPELDWVAAEEVLASAQLDLPLCGIALEANQGLFDSSESANQK
jgi:hypothetical protein